MTCCFTGHRNILPENMLHLPELLDREIERLIVCGVDTFRCGGALGFDTLAELKVLEKRNKYSFIKLELILPCEDQTNGWSQRNKDIYDYVISKADKVEYVTKTYTSTCMHERNRRLVMGSDFCIAYLTSAHGGTAYTCNYAKNNGVEVINLAEKV